MWPTDFMCSQLQYHVVLSWVQALGTKASDQILSSKLSLGITVTFL